MSAADTARAPIEPYQHGMLEVGDGQLVYWEQCGNPDGKPLLVLHGGPGGGCSPGMRRIGDPSVYRIVLFDQRGCGRSLPHAADHATTLEANTTEHLIADIERLREHLGIERWLVFGGSWGTTLALAYAQRYPQRVSELVLVGTGLTRRADVDWLYGGLRRFLPAQWARYRDAVPAGLRDSNLVQVYSELLNSPDPQVRQHAADEWIAWENAVVDLEPDSRGWPDKRADARYRLAFARICAHYFSHAAWLAEDQLLAGVPRLHGIPAVLVHGRFDPQCPLESAWRLAQAWPDAELVIVENAGHTSPSLGVAIGAALQRFGR
jgi:proline iminopeptidase